MIGGVLLFLESISAKGVPRHSSSATDGICPNIHKVPVQRHPEKGAAAKCTRRMWNSRPFGGGYLSYYLNNVWMCKCQGCDCCQAGKISSRTAQSFGRFESEALWAMEHRCHVGVEDVVGRQFDPCNGWAKHEKQGARHIKLSNLTSFQDDELKPSPYSYSKPIPINCHRSKKYAQDLWRHHTSKTSAPVHEVQICFLVPFVHFCKLASGISSQDWRNMAIPQSQGLNLFSACRSRAKMENVPNTPRKSVHQSEKFRFRWCIIRDGFIQCKHLGLPHAWVVFMGVSSWILGRWKCWAQQQVCRCINAILHLVAVSSHMNGDFLTVVSCANCRDSSAPNVRSRFSRINRTSSFAQGSH